MKVAVKPIIVDALETVPKAEKGTNGKRNKRKNRYYPGHSIGKIRKKTRKRTRDPISLAASHTPVGKAHKG